MERGVETQLTLCHQIPLRLLQLPLQTIFAEESHLGWMSVEAALLSVEYLLNG